MKHIDTCEQNLKENDLLLCFIHYKENVQDYVFKSNILLTTHPRYHENYSQIRKALNAQKLVIPYRGMEYLKISDEFFKSISDNSDIDYNRKVGIDYFGNTIYYNQSVLFYGWSRPITIKGYYYGKITNLHIEREKGWRDQIVTDNEGNEYQIRYKNAIFALTDNIMSQLLYQKLSQF